MNRKEILVISNVSKSFFGVEVLKSINLKLFKGEISGLIGENGAGKSTLVNIIGGLYRKDSGHIFLNGEESLPQNPKDAQKEGISVIHQELSLFSNLTVSENLFIENIPVRGLKMVQYKEMRKMAIQYLKKFGIQQVDPNLKIENFSMGIRQTVEIAKAIIKKARIIIFDEPTSSLSQKEKKGLFNIIKTLKETGVSIIYISHILDEVFEICDQITVLRDGNLIATRRKNEIYKEEAIKMMVGREIDKLYPRSEKVKGNVIYRAKNIRSKDTLKNVSLELKMGEIVGLFGLMGAGRTEFVKILFGVDKMDSGIIEFKGEQMHKINPVECIKQGISYITEDRRQEGLLMSKSIKDNIVIVILNKIINKLGIIRRKKENKYSDTIIKELKIKVFDKDLQLVRNLSGGNQQKVVIGKWLLQQPRVLIMDEPTKGIDVGSKYDIYELIDNLAVNGCAILFISSEVEELIGLCDRILIMSKGCIVYELDRNNFDIETILIHAFGEKRLSI